VVVYASAHYNEALLLKKNYIFDKESEGRDRLGNAGELRISNN
jgi:hypothetical protein